MRGDRAKPAGVPHHRPRRRDHGRRAFTLLELMVALAMVAGILISMNTFVFSMGELWGHNRVTGWWCFWKRVV